MAKFGELRVVWLEAFVQVAETGKRTAAAAEMETHQGNVTKYVQKLEQWLGGRMLFDDGVPARLMPDGERLLPLAKQMLQLAKEAHKPATVAATPYVAPPRRVSAEGLKPPANWRAPKDD